MAIEIKTFEDAKSLVLGWMNSCSLSPKEIDPCPDDLNFMIQGNSPNNIPFLVFQPKNRERAIVALVNVMITDISLAALNSMSETDRDKFLWNLRKELMFAPPNFAFDPEYERTGIPKGIQFHIEVYYGELTEGKLAEAVNYVIRSALWVIWSFKRIRPSVAEVKPVV